jgi:hypothetical protein
LHLITVVGDVWIPLAAQLTPANHDDGAEAEKLVQQVPLPTEIRYLLGDQHYNTPQLRRVCALKGWFVIATHRGNRPPDDVGIPVRRVFHKLRSVAIENFNGHFKTIFGGRAKAQVPTRGLTATRRFALGAVFVYQLALLYRFEHDGVRGSQLNVGLKPFLKAA